MTDPCVYCGGLDLHLWDCRGQNREFVIDQWMRLAAQVLETNRAIETDLLTMMKATARTVDLLASKVVAIEAKLDHLEFKYGARLEALEVQSAIATSRSH